MSSRLPRPAAAVAAVAVVLTGACGVPAAAPAAPPLTWTTCADDAALQCATLTVPLDRDDPADGRSVTLPVVKVRPGTRTGVWARWSGAAAARATGSSTT